MLDAQKFSSVVGIGLISLLSFACINSEESSSNTAPEDDVNIDVSSRETSVTGLKLEPSGKLSGTVEFVFQDDGNNYDSALHQEVMNEIIQGIKTYWEEPQVEVCGTMFQLSINLSYHERQITTPAQSGANQIYIWLSSGLSDSWQGGKSNAYAVTSMPPPPRGDGVIPPFRMQFFYKRASSDNAVAYAAAHEFGHALSFNHESNDPTRLMSPTISGSGYYGGKVLPEYLAYLATYGLTCEIEQKMTIHSNYSFAMTAYSDQTTVDADMVYEYPLAYTWGWANNFSPNDDYRFAGQEDPTYDYLDGVFVAYFEDDDWTLSPSGISASGKCWSTPSASWKEKDGRSTSPYSHIFYEGEHPVFQVDPNLTYSSGSVLGIYAHVKSQETDRDEYQQCKSFSYTNETDMFIEAPSHFDYVNEPQFIELNSQADVDSTFENPSNSNNCSSVNHGKCETCFVCIGENTTYEYSASFALKAIKKPR